MRPEHLLISHSRSTGFGQHLDHSTGVTSVGYGSDSSGKAGGEPATCRLDVLLGASRRLHFSQPSNPGSELGFRHLVFEAGEFKMGMGIDQAGKDDGVVKVLSRCVSGSGYSGIRTDVTNPPVGADQHGTVLDGRTFDREQPPRG